MDETTNANPPLNPPVNPPQPSAGTAGPGGDRSPPPAASTVINGARTEREISLEAELAAEKQTHQQTAKEKKERELRIAELQDELHLLRSAPPRDKKTALEEFFEG